MCFILLCLICLYVHFTHSSTSLLLLQAVYGVLIIFLNVHLTHSNTSLLILQAVYGVLKEAEHRSTFYIPYWNIPITKYIVPRQVGGHLFTGHRRQVGLHVCTLTFPSQRTSCQDRWVNTRTRVYTHTRTHTHTHTQAHAHVHAHKLKHCQAHRGSLFVLSTHCAPSPCLSTGRACSLAWCPHRSGSCNCKCV